MTKADPQQLAFAGRFDRPPLVTGALGSLLCDHWSLSDSSRRYSELHSDGPSERFALGDVLRDRGERFVVENV